MKVKNINAFSNCSNSWETNIFFLNLHEIASIFFLVGLLIIVTHFLCVCIYVYACVCMHVCIFIWCIFMCAQLRKEARGHDQLSFSIAPYLIFCLLLNLFL